MFVFILYLLVINTLSFIQIGYDKNLAKKNKRRISEKALLSFVFLGGTIGSGLAMLIFRHKTSKKSYLLKFWFIVLMQLLLTYFVYNYLLSK